MEMNQTLNSAEEVLDKSTEALRKGKAKVDRLAEKTSQVAPSNAFVFAALASMAVSAYLRISGRRQLALFIGEWVPSLLLFGIFNKLTKNFGSD